LGEFNSAVGGGGNVVCLPPPKARVVIAGPDDPRRGAFERFVAGRFAETYGAEIAPSFPLIAGLSGPGGEVLAAAGVRFAESGPLFLETYLEAPIEAHVGRALDCAAPREAIVEIGAFASRHPAWSMQLFEALPPWLAAVAGRRFAVATLRPELARTLGRAGDAAAAWGSYYAGQPKVYAGRVGGGAALAAMRERLRARSLERQARRARASA
jgi:hypothetical protein